MNLFSRTIVMVCIMGLSSVSLTSCKAKAKAVATTTVTEPVDYMKAAKIIGNHYNNKSNFSYISKCAKYADDKHKM
jgi:dihydroneopterin aldolase